MGAADETIPSHPTRGSLAALERQSAPLPVIEATTLSDHRERPEIRSGVSTPGAGSLPGFVPRYVPALDGLRGLAIAAVVLFHCGPKLQRAHLAWAVAWGWTGVNLFFVLSGYLITGILLESRSQPHYFKNFYARRGLRILPVYWVLLALNFVLLPLVTGGWTWMTMVAAGVAWSHFLLFYQNLVPGLAGVMFPTWSLCIEEHFYLVWAPVVRRCGVRILALVLLALLAASPLLRLALAGRLPATHTLFHLEGLAVGGLLALGLRHTGWSRAVWMRIAAAGGLAGVAAVVYAARGNGVAFDFLLALGFGGAVLAALLARATWYARSLQWAPLWLLGRISYGLYVTHMLVWSQLYKLDAAAASWGVWGDLCVVAARLLLAVGFATLLWYGLESRILRFKTRFGGKIERT